MINTILLVLIIILLIIVLSNYDYFTINNLKEYFTNNKLDMEIVVSRYNENLDWINKDPFNKYSITCYNKGINNDFNIESDHKIIKLPNVGKCDHTYLYHIINNYDNLKEYILFLPGSNDMKPKMEKSLRLINEMENKKKLVCIGTPYNNLKNDIYNFSLDKWITSNDQNKSINNENDLEYSEIRPFGKWYDYYFGNRLVKFASYKGIMAITRKHVHQHPKYYYETFLKLLEKSSNPEAGHYIERAWCAIFYPLFDTDYITMI